MDRNTHWLCIDGEWMQNVDILPVYNRSFLYGDAIFETMRTLGVDLVFAEGHSDRLKRGLDMLEIPLIEALEISELCNLVASLVHKNKWYNGARVRLTVYRRGEGRYTPQDNEAGFLLDGEPMQTDPFYPFTGTGKILTAFTEIKKPLNILSTIKTTSSVFYVLAGKHAKEQGYDDCFIMNDQGGIIETVNSNVFVISGNSVVSPGPATGALDGTMRKQVMRLMAEKGFEISERGITEQDLEVADEVFLTNAVQGINWVKGYKERRYYHHRGMEISEKLNSKISNRDF